MELFFIFSLLFSTIIFIFIFLSLHFFPSEQKTTQCNTPLPLPGKNGWPFIGETLDYLSKIKNGCPEKFASERRSKYSSKAFKTSIIGQEMVILGGPEGNKFLFSNESKLVKAWWPTSVDKIFPKSHSTPNHEDYNNVRKFYSNFLKADTLQRFVGTANLVMKDNLKAHWNNQKQIKASFAVKKYSFALSCRLFLSVEDPQKVESLAKPIDEIAKGLLSMAINFPGTAFNRAIKASKEMREEMREEIEGMIKLRKIELSEKKVSPFQDLLSQMLVATDDKGQFSNEYDIASYILGMLHGSYGTVNAALTFIVKYLAEYPDVYSEVLREQMEISKAKELNELLNWEDLRKMKYSWNVANEVLRLIPPIFGTFREAITDFTYDGYMIPKGLKLHLIAHDTHKNPEYFPDPEKFDPSRFGGDGPVPYTYVPFGGGARMCPGNEYTRMIILVFMHNVVTKFRWEKLIPNEKVVSDPHPRPAHGLPICLYSHENYLIL